MKKICPLYLTIMVGEAEKRRSLILHHVIRELEKEADNNDHEASYPVYPVKNVGD